MSEQIRLQCSTAQPGTHTYDFVLGSVRVAEAHERRALDEKHVGHSVPCELVRHQLRAPRRRVEWPKLTEESASDARAAWSLQPRTQLA